MIVILKVFNSTGLTGIYGLHMLRLLCEKFVELKGRQENSEHTLHELSCLGLIPDPVINCQIGVCLSDQALHHKFAVRRIDVKLGFPSASISWCS